MCMFVQIGRCNMSKLWYNIGKFFDKHLRWHSCEKLGNDGCSDYGICKYCRETCLKDSQGNWFSVKDIGG